MKLLGITLFAITFCMLSATLGMRNLFQRKVLEEAWHILREAAFIMLWKVLDANYDTLVDEC